MADQKLKFVAEWVDKGLKKGAADSTKALQTTEKATASLGQQFAVITAAGAAAVVVLKQVYEIAKQGAQIELAAVRFDRLAESIGTTGDALRYDLANATDGLMTSAEQMKLAGDLMSLGLASTHDQAVRLSAVSSQLGMDMNQLTLTLANQTTMRFDSLGVAVAGFDEVLAHTIETGGTFTDAFLTQAEAQIEKVGSIADTSAGKLMQFEVVWKEFGNTVKQSTSEAVVPFIDRWTRAMQLLQSGEVSRAEANMILFSEAALDNAEAAAKVDDTWKDYYATLNNNAGAVDDATRAQNAFMESIEAVNTSLGNQIEKMIENIEWNERGGPVFQQAYDTIIAGAGTAAEKQAQLTNLAINYMTVMGELDGMSIEQIASQIEDLGVDMDLAWRLAMGVYGQLNKINGMEVSADVFINVHGKVPKLGTGGGVIQGYGEGASGAGGIITDMPIIQQAGGDFIVPPQFAGDSMPIRATAGERVKVDTASNTAQDNIAAMFQNQNFAQQIGKTIARELIRQGV